MVDIIHRVGIKAPISKVYAALSTLEGVKGWWSKDTVGVSEPGGTIDFTFHTPSGERLGAIGMKVVALKPDEAVHWHVASGPDEWIGTDVNFKLSRSDNGDYTIVRFAHENWREAVEFTAHCSTKWAVFLLSLKELVETGKGRPAPHDIEISDWH